MYEFFKLKIKFAEKNKTTEQFVLIVCHVLDIVFILFELLMLCCPQDGGSVVRLCVDWTLKYV